MESNIYQLIDKYFDGETTLDEERTIAEYLHSHEQLPDDLKPLKAIFDATATAKSITTPVEPIVKDDVKPNHNNRHRMLISLISGAAAAIILFAIGIKLNIDTSETTIPIAHQATPDIVCHVNGQLVADNEAAIAETNRVLEGVMGDVNLAMAEVKRLNILYK